MALELGSIIYMPRSADEAIFTAVTFGISTLGLLCSILALILLLVTACCFREWRQNYKNQLLLQFMIARWWYTFFRYVFDLRVLLLNTCDEKACVLHLDEVLLIYTEIVLVSWMFIFSRHMYDSLVVVLSTKVPNIWKVSALTWLTPLVVSTSICGLYHWQADKKFVIYYLYLSTVKWPILFVNGVILAMILKSLTKTDSVNKKNQSNRKVIVIMTLMIWSFCVHQFFVDIYKLVYVYLNVSSFLLVLFNIGAMYHCSVAILFWVFGNEKTRTMWKIKFGCAAKMPLSPQSSLGSTK